MTTLFGSKTGYYIKEILPGKEKDINPIPKKKRTYTQKIILWYGNLSDLSSNWHKLIVDIDDIKEFIPSCNGYNKIKVIWKEPEKYDIDMINKIEFA